jgi:ABC-type Mn2+/Zn2+ transport system permease subunit
LIAIAPYTKVEESFNVQATHDLLEFGPGHLAAFDHLQFPGVVPRTFVGALVVSELCRPVYSVLRAFGATPLVGLYLVFTSLIVPALATRTLKRWRLLAAYGVAASGYALGLLLSALTDWPSGPAIVWVMTVVAVGFHALAPAAVRAR